MSRLSSISSSPTLREYAQGAAQEAIMPVADFLALMGSHWWSVEHKDVITKKGADMGTTVAGKALPRTSNDSFDPSSA